MADGNGQYASDLSFVRRAELQPDESLLSLLCRVADLNGYAKPQIVFQVCEQRLAAQGIADGLFHPRQWASYTCLGQVLRLEPMALYGGTLHPWAPSLVLPPQVIQYASLPSGTSLSFLPSAWTAGNHVYRQNSTAYCPDCLAEHRYGRAHWQLHSLPICLRHHRLLLDACPHCHQPLNVADLVRMHCSRCGHTLAGRPETAVPVDGFGVFAQHAIQHWLGMTPAPTQFRWWTRLPQWDSRVTYQLVWILSQRLVNLECDFSPFCAMPKNVLWQDATVGAAPLARRYQALALAVQSLLEWPHAFFELLDFLRSETDGPANLAPRLLPLWGQPDFEFLRSTLEQYRKPFDRHCRLEDYPRPPVRLFQDHPSLCLPPATLQRLVGVDLRLLAVKQPLPRTALAAPSDNGQMLRRKAVARLLHTWDTPVMFRHAAIWLGLSYPVVERLAQMGVFDQPVQDAEGWHLNRQRVLQWLEETLTALRSNRPVEYPLTLRETQSCLEPFGETDVSLVDGLRCGSFVAGLPAGAHDLSSLRFDELQLFWFAARETRMPTILFESQVAERLKAPFPALEVWRRRRWLPAGRIAGFVNWTYELSHIWAFLHDAAMESELIDHLGFDRHKLQQWIRVGRLRAVSGPGIDASPVYLFSRSEIDCLARRLPRGSDYQPLRLRWSLLDYENYARRQRRRQWRWGEAE